MGDWVSCLMAQSPRQAMLCQTMGTKRKEWEKSTYKFKNGSRTNTEV